MLRPTLVLYISEPELDFTLLSSSTIQTFDVSRIHRDDSWVQAMIEISPKVAIIQSNNLTENEFELLKANKVLAKSEVVFINSDESDLFVDKAIELGSCYRFRLPLDLDYLDEVIKGFYREFTKHAPRAITPCNNRLDQFGHLHGSCTSMRGLYRMIDKASRSDSCVFVVGESGTGKELVAETIHAGSDRADKVFIAINCGALSSELVASELFGHKKGAFTGATKDRSGVFEKANGGTLFLDEVTELPVDHQVMLLRVLESGDYKPVGSDVNEQSNVRVIAATNCNPITAIKEGRFRKDLYYRLCQFPIWLPPLRERGNDVIGLAQQFLNYRNLVEHSAITFSDEALRKLEAHRWPGNVRELKHAVERAYLLSDDIINAENIFLDSDDQTGALDQVGIPDWSDDVSLDEAEKKIILMTLERYNGNKAESASKLGISVKTLYNKLEKYRDLVAP